MSRQLDVSATNTPCQILKSLFAIAAIAVGSAQTVHAGALFGNVTADLFEPAVTLTSADDVNAGENPNAASTERALEPDGAETATDEPRLQSRTQTLSRPQPSQTSRRRRSTRIDASALRRPPALLPLYITFATLQMLDAHSTTQALKNGGVEANPFVSGLAGNTGALYAAKIATTAATVLIGEKLWRKSRFGAIVTMLAVNSAYAVVVRHNYGIAGQ